MINPCVVHVNMGVIGGAVNDGSGTAVARRKCAITLLPVEEYDPSGRLLVLAVVAVVAAVSQSQGWVCRLLA